MTLEGAWIWAGGMLTEAKSARLEPDNRAFWHGEGLLETIPTRKGVGVAPWRRSAHVARLVRSCQDLVGASPFPAQQLEDLLLQVALGGHAALPAAERGQIRLLWSLSRGWDFLEPLENWSLERHATVLWRPYPATGLGAAPHEASPLLKLGVLDVPPPPNTAQYKRSSGYAGVGAQMQSLRAQGLDEALRRVVTPQGRLVLGAQTGNVLGLTKDGEWVSPGGQAMPPLLEGVTLGRLVSYGPQLGARLQLRTVPWPEPQGWVGAWLVSSLRGVAPIGEIAGQPIPFPREAKHWTVKWNEILEADV